MARFCSRCGTRVKESARFCNQCGARLRQRSPVRPSAPESEPEKETASRSPASGEASSGMPAPPQFWESYDYPGEEEPRPTSFGGREGSTGDPSDPLPRDASRPLPPLSQVMPDDMEAARHRAREITMNFSLWAAGIVLFPIPFSDLVLLMPVQSAMVISIGRAYGVKDPPEKVLAILAGACGASVFGQITTIFVANLIPIIGKLVSAPFVFGWTYGLGEVAMRYFESQGTANRDELREIFKRASKEAKNRYTPEKAPDARQSLENLREYVSEDEYRRIQERFLRKEGVDGAG